jgi:hypothetical protein
MWARWTPQLNFFLPTFASHKIAIFFSWLHFSTLFLYFFKYKQHNMTICRFFQQGRCARGNTCNFEHVQPNGQGFGNQAGAAAAANKYK